MRRTKVKKKEKFLDYSTPVRCRTGFNAGALVAACGESRLRNLLRAKQFSSHGVMVLKNDPEFFKSVERRV
jgi:S-ribosylhomocysteine lyase LuxS involved in autoinducer biosynthesis